MVRRLCFLSGFLLLFLGWVDAGEPIFVPVKVDGPVHDPANHSYWFGPFSEQAMRESSYLIDKLIERF